MRPVVPALVILLLLPLTPAAPLADDAGSGADAPNTPTDVVRILPGVLLEGNVTGAAGDLHDFYSLDVSAGERIEAVAWPTAVCLSLRAPDLTVRKLSCGTGAQPAATETADVGGIWYVGIHAYFNTPSSYRFAVGLDATPPDPALGVSLGTNQPWIQPGGQVTTPAGSCTLNFVYDGTGSKAGKVYIGTAAHCFTALGQSASSAGYANFGEVVYMGDYNGLNTGSFSNGIPGTQTDFALIEVDAAFHDVVKADVKGHEGFPTGGVFPRTSVRVGDRLDFSGYGIVWSTTAPTREMRSGFYTLSSGNNWNAVAPILSGDSGGPALHADGRAFGVATHLSLLGAGGPFLQVSLNEADAAGFPVQLRNAS